MILAIIFVFVQFSYEILRKSAQGLLELISGYAPGMRQAFFDGRVFCLLPPVVYRELAKAQDHTEPAHARQQVLRPIRMRSHQVR